MGNINIRTDLAVELNEAVDKSDSRYSGVIVREHIDKVSLVKVTTLEIINEEGEKLFNRKAGISLQVTALYYKHLEPSDSFLIFRCQNTMSDKWCCEGRHTKIVI